MVVVSCQNEMYFYLSLNLEEFTVIDNGKKGKQHTARQVPFCTFLLELTDAATMVCSCFNCNRGDLLSSDSLSFSVRC